jgi:HEAT repeat protein
MKMTRKRIIKLLALSVGSLAMLASTQMANAGRGGSAVRLEAALLSGSQEKIIAEVERAERLVCFKCVDTVMTMLDDPRYEVREVAAWWFARRPAQKLELHDRSVAAIYGDDATLARNATDILGTFRDPKGIAALTHAAQRTDLGPEVRAHAVMNLGIIGHNSANPVLEAAMADSDQTVRYQAVTAWLKIRGQTQATAAVSLVTDTDNQVRRKAAAVVGSVREASGRATLEARLRDDEDAVVRRNAAWALGQIGDIASLEALDAATDDPSPLVRATARRAKRLLR